MRRSERRDTRSTIASSPVARYRPSSRSATSRTSVRPVVGVESRREGGAEFQARAPRRRRPAGSGNDAALNGVEQTAVTQAANDCQRRSRRRPERAELWRLLHGGRLRADSPVGLSDDHARLRGRRLVGPRREPRHNNCCERPSPDDGVSLAVDATGRARAVPAVLDIKTGRSRERRIKRAGRAVGCLRDPGSGSEFEATDSPWASLSAKPPAPRPLFRPLPT